MGQLISKSKEKLWDIDIKNFTVSPLDQIKCIPNLNCLEVPAPLPGRGHGGLPALRPRSPRARSGSCGPHLGREEVV